MQFIYYTTTVIIVCKWYLLYSLNYILARLVSSNLGKEYQIMFFQKKRKQLKSGKLRVRTICVDGMCLALADPK
jgi:hypothetical protein